MPLRRFICPDKQRIEVKDCLKEGGCRLGGNRCATRSYLRLVGADRPWTGRPSTTMLIQGTMCSFLKLTNDYAVSPDQRAFMILGTSSHSNLEAADDEYSFLEERFDGEDVDVTGIADVLECENGKNILVDYKTSGSFKVAKALGFYVDDEPTGEVFKTGKRAGEQKTRKILKRDDSKMDRKEWSLQLSKYAMEFEKKGFKVDELRIQCIVRDGGTFVARSRGVFRNIYYFKIDRLPDDYIQEYFDKKKTALLTALKKGKCDEICSAEENWDSLKCQSYCEVAEFCKYGKYLKKEKEDEDMAIKGLSDIRRLPRLGHLRLGIKKKTAAGKEYPSEVDYFILDPQTPSELENQKLIDEFHKLYGDQPKSIQIMFPVGNPEVYFPQFYKRYGSGSSLKCKGDGEFASCATAEFAKGLKVLGTDEMGLTKVACLGKGCPFYMRKECTEVATLQVLLPEIPGAGVWQVVTGSFHSIVNLNSCIDHITAMCGRAHMIPLKLERRAQETTFEGKKATHYILHINMELRLADIQRFAMIEPTKVLLELPAPEEDKEDILFRENASIEPATEVLVPEVLKPEVSAMPKENPLVQEVLQSIALINTKEDAIAHRRKHLQTLLKVSAIERDDLVAAFKERLFQLSIPLEDTTPSTKQQLLDRIAEFKHSKEATNWLNKHMKEIASLPEAEKSDVMEYYKQINTNLLMEEHGEEGTQKPEGDEINWEAELATAESIEKSNEVWVDYEKTSPSGPEKVKMRRVKDKRVVELRKAE